MKLCRKLLVPAFLLSQLLPASAQAFVLLPEPPASGFVMNLDLEPSAPLQTTGYGVTTWNKLAEMALATWNAAGVGSGPDFGFLGVANPRLAGGACARDGVNEVTWASDNCGFSFGDAIAITNRWVVNGLRVEEDVIFNSNLPFDAYRGPLRYSNGRYINDFYRIAVHEFGHVVGLDHPNLAGQKVAAIMNSYLGNIDSLQPDDMAGARAIAWNAVSASQLSTVALNFLAGWNLAGNGSGAAIDVARTFGNSTDILTVWKWVAAESKWAFYSPSLSAEKLSDYASSKGYALLATVDSSEGFWVNARKTFTAHFPAGTTVSSASFQTGLGTGWNLLAIGDNKTPREFNAVLGAPPAYGDVPSNLTTLWAWDAAKANWYFYAPSLEAKGGTVLSDYIYTKGYLEFGTKTLDPAAGFWVNKP
ncbi:MAG: matrixin family metalloprotease [Betaproteobacteria bacterium]|nr:matrixin family metalloprotease [Betaproteobacteria bacterium]